MYWNFEADPDSEMEFAVAETIGMSVARMRAELSSDEYVRWCIYLARKGQRRELG